LDTAEAEALATLKRRLSKTGGGSGSGAQR
jgi:hypothetical protein